MEIKWAVLFLCFTILIMTLVEFIALDKKIDKALENQGKINECSFDTNKEQAEEIRILKSDIGVIYRLAVTGEFQEKENDN